MRILITDGMDKAAMAQLRELGHEVVEQFYEPDQLGAALRDFDAVVVRSKTKVRANHIDEAKGGKLKLIIRGGVGVDNIDVKYAEENGIAVRNTPGASSQSVAELAMGHMFACTRYISIAGHTMREGKWEKKAYGKGIELQGKTLGIIGFGRIGQHLGVMAKAIGMNVVAYSTTRRPEVEAKFGIPYVTLEELLAQSDFISLHAPAAPGAPLINADTHRQDEGRRGHHQHLPWCQRGRGCPAGCSGVRQGPGRRSGRLRRRAHCQRRSVQPSHGVLHAPHRRCHRGGSEAHRHRDRGYHPQLLISLSCKKRRGTAEPYPFFFTASQECSL